MKKAVFKSFKTNVNNPKEKELPKLLYLDLIQDHLSYGDGRNFHSLILLLINQLYEGQKNLALLVSTNSEFDVIWKYLEDHFHNLPFNQITLILENVSRDGEISREDRKLDEFQRNRRKHMATLRNMLLYTALEDEEVTIWLDADIYEVPVYLSQKMTLSGHDIITPACVLGNEKIDYDQNAWKGQRTKPTALEYQQLLQGKSTFIPYHAVGTLFVSELSKFGKEYVELDSVGGTMLFVKSEIFRKGINFPPFHAVGTDWDLSEGYDGIETEGLCYLAKSLGYKCWGMPFEVIHHTDT
ncbi:Anp1-domain-containing protein [Globomyces pollinis-pini]|nr:Anp1-domain-containing protein [Globomyces pollinis-pini]